MPWHSKPMFVYGTLKRGQPNYNILQKAIEKSEAYYLGLAVTVDHWPLIVYEPYNTPFLLDCKGTGKHLVGEVYLVSTNTLASLDRLEEHPNCYRRDTITVKFSHVETESAIAGDYVIGNIVNCDAYFMHSFRQELLLDADSFLDNYVDSTERKYVLIKDRPPGRSCDELVKELRRPNK